MDAEARRLERGDPRGERLRRLRERAGLCWACGVNEPLPGLDPNVVHGIQVGAPCGLDVPRKGKVRVFLDEPATLKVFDCEEGTCGCTGEWVEVDQACDHGDPMPDWDQTAHHDEAAWREAHGYTLEQCPTCKQWKRWARG